MESKWLAILKINLMILPPFPHPIVGPKWCKSIFYHTLLIQCTCICNQQCCLHILQVYMSSNCRQSAEKCSVCLKYLKYIISYLWILFNIFWKLETNTSNKLLSIQFLTMLFCSKNVYEWVCVCMHVFCLPSVFNSRRSYE